MNAMSDDYGYFDSANGEYVITDPETPMPWINVLSSGDYGLTISQAGGGYSWRTHASLNRITRWDQDLVRDVSGKYLYVRDAQSGSFWSPTLQPAGGAASQIRVTHGTGYSTFTSEHSGISSTLTITVPLHDPCELWILRLENRGTTPRRLQVFSYLEWCLGVSPDWHREFHRLFIETRYESQLSAIFATKNLWELPSADANWNRPWPYVAFHSVSTTAFGFETDKARFLGRHGDLASPLALREGKLGGHSGRGLDAIASLGTEVSLEPGEAVTLVFALGAADSEEQAGRIIQRFRDPAGAEAALAEVKTFWRELLGNLRVETPDEGFDLMANQWLAYQSISGRLWGRSAYYQMGGAYGFRDQLQDSLVWLLLGRPEATLGQIKLHAAHQFQDGTVLHWWHPLAETGLPSHYSDDLLWLPFVTLEYLRETGDFSALDSQIPFFDGGPASLGEHCTRSIEKALQRRSPRGLCLILEGDWNDGLNTVGPNGKGESVWTSHFLYLILTSWAELPDLDDITRERYLSEAAALAQAVNTYGWDGDWYWRASKDNGQLIGSATNAEGAIFLNAQTWAVLSGDAPQEWAERAMAAAREKLYSPYGALLLSPPYSEPDPEIGYLTRYAPGTRENGGVYSHASCWAVLAEGRIHGAEAAYQLWRSFAPPWRGLDAGAYRAEPYVMPGNVNGPLSAFPGQGAWTWYTGSAAWNLRAMVEGVLGVRATFAGLSLRPDLPATWEGFRLKRWFRGAVYDIEVRRARPGEDKGIRVSGKPWAGSVLPVAPARQTVKVEMAI
jgi:cellobiose phosphorylase